MADRYKIRVTCLGKTLTDLVCELNRRGHHVSTAEFYRFRKNAYTGDKSERVLTAAGEILEEWEAEENERRTNLKYG